MKRGRMTHTCLAFGASSLKTCIRQACAALCLRSLSAGLMPAVVVLLRAAMLLLPPVFRLRRSARPSASQLLGLSGDGTSGS